MKVSPATLTAGSWLALVSLLAGLVGSAPVYDGADFTTGQAELGTTSSPEPATSSEHDLQAQDGNFVSDDFTPEEIELLFRQVVHAPATTSTPRVAATSARPIRTRRPERSIGEARVQTMYDNYEILEPEYERILDQLFKQACDSAISEKLCSDGERDSSPQDLAKLQMLVDECDTTSVAETDGEPTNETGDTCAICLELETPEVSLGLPCGHYYHAACLQELIQCKLRKCPICAESFRVQQVRRHLKPEVGPEPE